VDFDSVPDSFGHEGLGCKVRSDLLSIRIVDDDKGTSYRTGLVEDPGPEDDAALFPQLTDRLGMGGSGGIAPGFATVVSIPGQDEKVHQYDVTRSEPTGECQTNWRHFLRDGESSRAVRTPRRWPSPARGNLRRSRAGALLGDPARSRPSRDADRPGTASTTSPVDVDVYLACIGRK
jgi:hypothetical protein